MLQSQRRVLTNVVPRDIDTTNGAVKPLSQSENPVDLLDSRVFEYKRFLAA